MNRKRTALGVAAGGVLAGAVGLGVLAIPAGADETPPALPPISAEALVQSVATAQLPALDGKVTATENLGLPVKLLPDGFAGATVATDGQGRFRASLPDKQSERTIVSDGTTVWSWNSADRTVTKTARPADAKPHGQLGGPGGGGLSDPATMAKDVIAKARESSDVQVDGTAKVAGRPAYELVLTPKPTERTLLREVRVAVDSQTRIPLELEVLANGQADPALKVGFSELNVRAQDPAQFTFTPPAGAKVTEGKPDDGKAGDHAKAMQQVAPQFVGDGWDTVAVVKLPADVTAMLNGGAPASGTRARGDGQFQQGDALAMLRQFGKEIDVAGGKAWVFNTKVATAVVTADGRAALGAVPQQVLVEALGQVN